MRAATIYSGTGPLTILASPLSEVAYQMADTNIAKDIVKLNADVQHGFYYFSLQTQDRLS
jgi:hypothetical protein